MKQEIQYNSNNIVRYIVSIFSITIINLLPSIAFSAEGISVGAGRLFPEARVALGYDDNLLLTNQDELDSAFLKTDLNTAMLFKRKANEYKILANLGFGLFESSSDDNYADFGISGMTDLALSKTLKLKLGAGYNYGHDPRGSVDRAIGKSPDTWHLGTVSGKLIYGREKSRGRIELDTLYSNQDYDDFITVEHTEDKEKAKIAGTFFYRVLPKMELLFELSAQDTDYQSDFSAARDNKEYKARTGALWQATKQTSGSLKIGYARKDFDLDRIEDFSGLDWEARVVWEPNTRSAITFTTSNNTVDSTGVGSFVKNQYLALSLQHKLTRQLMLMVMGSYLNADYQDVVREDDTSSFSTQLEYLFKERVTLGAQYKFATRDSNSDVNEYDRNILFVYVKGMY